MGTPNHYLIISRVVWGHPTTAKTIRNFWSIIERWRDYIQSKHTADEHEIALLSKFTMCRRISQNEQDRTELSSLDFGPQTYRYELVWKKKSQLGQGNVLILESTSYLLLICIANFCSCIERCGAKSRTSRNEHTGLFFDPTNLFVDEVLPWTMNMTTVCPAWCLLILWQFQTLF